MIHPSGILIRERTREGSIGTLSRQSSFVAARLNGAGNRPKIPGSLANASQRETLGGREGTKSPTPAIDTDMVGQIRASSINEISQILCANLAPVEHPAAAIVYLCTEAANDLVGKEVSLLNPEFRRRIGFSR
jgi:hypothetical protein